ncbi:MAG: hypothetical protein QX203_03850 [Methylococcaceae bacterium]
MSETEQEKWQKICADTAKKMIEHIKGSELLILKISMTLTSWLHDLA